MTTILLSLKLYTSVSTGQMHTTNTVIDVRSTMRCSASVGAIIYSPTSKFFMSSTSRYVPFSGSTADEEEETLEEEEEEEEGVGEAKEVEAEVVVVEEILEHSLSWLVPTRRALRAGERG